MPLITENQLDDWVRAHSSDAQGVTVELIYRLVAASCREPTERRFPLGDSIGQHGPDGVLDTPTGFAPFVPEGRSYWEIGTGIRPREKATDDYNGLTAGIPETLRRDATFVFVTPLSARREWEQTWEPDAQGSWVEDRRARNDWNDVRILDGTKVVDWLQQFPAVEFWLASKFGVPTQDLQTLEESWTLIRSVGEPPPLKPKVFLANRDEACAKLKELLDDNLVQLKLATHHPDQVVDFVSAFAASLEGESRFESLGRSVIVSSPSAWYAVCALRTRHILIADVALDLNGGSGTKLIQKARQAGHAVVFGGPRGGIPDPTRVDLPSPRAHHVRDELVACGYTEERARLLAQRSNGNLGTLLRCLQNLALLPAWAEASAAAELAIAAFVGSWVDSSESDRVAVESIAGKAYGEWVGKIHDNASGPNTPLAHYEGNWKFVTRYEGWYVLGPRLFNEHIDRFRKVATSVLSEHDPQFELPPSERFAARARGKTLAHSQMLRNGLAESLALLGSHGRALTSCSASRPEATAAVVVRDLLSNMNWVRWASLDDLLPLLAEASPGEFLTAVENALAARPCPFDELFAQEGRGILGRNYTTGLLWALETLAWSPAELGRVVLCLAALDTRDPGGQWGNRPLHSLTTILLPWLPQTCAPIERRVAASRSLLTEYPTTGWKLLLTLLPSSHGASHGCRKPEWREMLPEGWSSEVTDDEYRQQVFAYADLAVEFAKSDVSKLAELCDRLDELPPAAHERILEHMTSDAVRLLPEQDRLHVWSRLDALAKRHKKFSGAEWALPPAEIQTLERVAAIIAPQAPFYRHQRLFSERWGELFEERGNFEQQALELERRRNAAVQELLGVGVTRVFEFARAVEAPWRVGIALGSIAASEVDQFILPRLLEVQDPPIPQVVGAFSLARVRAAGWNWVDDVTASGTWGPELYGRFLAFLPFSPQAWSRASRLLGADESPYWRHTPAQHYELREGFETAADNLLRHGRPQAALRCLHRLIDEEQPLNQELAIKALLAAVSSDEPQHQLDSHDIVEMIKALQDDARTDREALYRIEWAYLPLLNERQHAAPKTLARTLADDPVVFCDAVRLVFRSKGTGNADTENEGPTDRQKEIAANGYTLLHEWATPPGLCADGTYDGVKLESWLRSVRENAAATRHLDVALNVAGQVLLYVPPDPDGLWIHRAAAAALNVPDAGPMRAGFRSEALNSRGVHWVDPTGKPERELASKYRAQAEALETAGYPRFAATMRELADTYDSEAERVSARHEFDD